MIKCRKAGHFLNTALNIIFGVLMLCIFYGTVFLDKRIRLPYPNMLDKPNALFYLTAALLLGLLCLVFRANQNKGRALSERSEGRSDLKYRVALAVIFLIVAVLQILVTKWMLNPVEFQVGDFKMVSTSAWDLAHGGSFKGIDYFVRSPNNLNIAIVGSWVFRIFKHEKSMLLLGALLTNASVILASLAVNNILRRRDIALAVAVVGEILVALSWRAFLPYSDNYGMIFVALMVWVYTTKLRPEIKMPLIIFFCACGCYIKVTCAICLAALAVNGLIAWLRNGNGRLNFRRMALYTVSLIVLIGGMLALQGPIRRHYGYEPGEYPKGWQYMFMVGQNTKGLGCVTKANANFRNNAIEEYGDPVAVNRAFLDRAVGFIKERGLAGNLAFYEAKLDHVYGDGYFHKIQFKYMKKQKGTFLYEIYNNKGKYFQYGAMLMQTLWNMILLTMMLYSLGKLLEFIRSKRRSEQPSAEAQPPSLQGMNNVLKLIVIGVSLYMMLLEGRSKYLYMFLPAFLTAFGTMQAVNLNVIAGLIRPSAEKQS